MIAEADKEYGASEASDADFQAALNGIEPSLAFDGTDVTTIRGDQTVQFWMESASGTFFGILDNAAAGGGTFYCTGVQADVDGTNACASDSW